MRVISAVSVDIRLYDSAHFPSDLLRFDDVVEDLKSRFAFDAVYFQTDRHQQPQPVVFSLVEGKCGDIRIAELSVQQRKVVIRVFGDSADGDKVSDDVQSWLVDHVPFESLEPVSHTYESILTAQLEVGFPQLVASGLRATVQDSHDTFPHASRIYPSEVTFTVEYGAPPEIQAQRIQFVPKPITLSRRNDSTDDESLVESKMPLRSDAHAKVLASIENTISS